ncbi:calponin homology domain-containing protein [Lipomyces japonicus]|uniref:calponin homology domain-containing protein n=1 Tax=Lipomyces japonicus TaxID=56871 RepID=UPI0034CF700F
MGESRQELLAWINDLLQLNLVKVEQCGTGAPLCQIFDSIFGDIPMTKVKFNVNSEYQYLSNFKVLQSAFLHHKVEKIIPVEKLVKCKFQDNLEFLQWAKRVWDQSYPGGDYDAVARRKGQPVTAVGHASISGSGAGRTSSRSASVVSNRKSSTNNTTATNTVLHSAGNSSSSGGGAAVRTRTPSATVQVAHLQAENAAIREQAEALERERDFYFSKLRDIEILVQASVDDDLAGLESGAITEVNPDKDVLIKQVQEILYMTEEGFEIPEPAEEAQLVGEIGPEEEEF